MAEILTPMHPLAEEMDYSVINTRESQKSKKSGKDKQSDGLSNRQGVAQKDMQAVRKILKFLESKKYPHEDKLSSLCGRFETNKKTLLKFHDVFSMWEVDKQ